LIQVFSAPAKPSLNHWGLSGSWNVNAESAVLQAVPGKIVFRFHSRDLHLVLAPAKETKPVRFVVRLDGAAPGQNCGVDTAPDGSSEIREPRLYQLIRQKGPIEAARDELLGRGVEISEVFHDAGGVYAGTDEPYLFGRLRISSPDPEHRSYRSFASFNDPDGNGWLFQEVTTRLPGRIDPAATSFGSASDLASALRRAEAAHGKHEKRTGKADPNWPDWYAEYMVAEQAGTELPT
jgi:Thioredoxin like C-terminal domain